MRIGTKSVLFGVHQFAIHPIFVALAWWKLYRLRRVTWTWAMRDEIAGRPRCASTSLWDPRLWIAFIVHDIGYLGKPNMDGPEGERHPFAGARIMGALFGYEWHVFVLAHSRFLAKQLGLPPSPLCFPDKLAFPMTPRWLYLLLANASGEIDEYMAKSDRNNNTGSKYAHMHLSGIDQRAWHADVCEYVTKWVDEHKDGRADTWTKVERVAASSTGVLQ